MSAVVPHTKPITHTDRLALGSLVLADVGLGIFLIAISMLPGITWGWVHALVGVISLLLSLPAAVAALSGRIPGLADEGVLVNVGVMTFMAAEVIALPSEGWQKVGLAIFVISAALATMGLYLRIFGALHLRPQGRRVRASTSGVET